MVQMKIGTFLVKLSGREDEMDLKPMEQRTDRLVNVTACFLGVRQGVIKV